MEGTQSELWRMGHELVHIGVHPAGGYYVFSTVFIGEGEVLLEGPVTLETAHALIKQRGDEEVVPYRINNEDFPNWEFEIEEETPPYISHYEKSDNPTTTIKAKDIPVGAKLSAYVRGFVQFWKGDDAVSEEGILLK